MATLHTEHISMHRTLDCILPGAGAASAFCSAALPETRPFRALFGAADSSLLAAAATGSKAAPDAAFTCLAALCRLPLLVTCLAWAGAALADAARFLPPLALLAAAGPGSLAAALLRPLATPGLLTAGGSGLLGATGSAWGADWRGALAGRGSLGVRRCAFWGELGAVGLWPEPDGGCAGSGASAVVPEHVHVGQHKEAVGWLLRDQRHLEAHGDWELA